MVETFANAIDDKGLRRIFKKRRDIKAGIKKENCIYF
jgi:hypothetical protein